MACGLPGTTSCHSNPLPLGRRSKLPLALNPVLRTDGPTLIVPQRSMPNFTNKRSSLSLEVYSFWNPV